MSGTRYTAIPILAALALFATPIAAEDDGTTAESAAPSREATGSRPGPRDHLAQRGIEVRLVAQGEPSTNVSGGLRRGTVMRAQLQATLDLDTDRLLAWRGGRLHVGLQAFEGGNASDDLVGDLQGFDNVDSSRFRQVSELWLEQRFFREGLRLKIGKSDANADFARVEASGEFLNSSAGYSPTVQGFPTYPDPAMSVSLFARLPTGLSMGAGIYDGATNEGCHGRTGDRGLATFLGAPDAFFYVGEGEARYSLRDRRGRVAFGAWRHTGRFQGFDGTTRRGTFGFYGVLEQRLAHKSGDEEQGLDLFVQLGSSDGRFAEIDGHASVGVSATGLFRRRGRDVAGLMLTSVSRSSRCAGTKGPRRESVLELYYGLRLRPWLLVKPDLQYIVNPGASDAKDAVVGTLRLSLLL